MGNMFSTMKNAIYYNYTQTIKKLINEYSRKGIEPIFSYRIICARAYEDTKNALRRCFNVEDEKSAAEVFNAFTRTGNCRQNIIELTKGDPKAIRMMLITEFMQKEPNNEKEKALIDGLRVTQSNYSLEFVYDSIRKVLIDGNFEGFSRFSKGNGQEINYRENMERIINPNELLDIFMKNIINEYEKPNAFQVAPSDRKSELIREQIRNAASKHPDVKNVRVNNNIPYIAMSKATDIEWTKTRHRAGSVGNDLYFASDIGKGRNNQEDSVVLMYHPANPNFKMLVVADGLGGCEHGERASSNIVFLISEWFKTLPVELLKSGNEQELQKEFERQIKIINKVLFAENKNVDEDKRSGSTFCGALVGEKSTIISNVGDSRAYTYSKGKLKQVTRDDTFVFYGYEQGIIDKEDIRFQPGSNELLQAVGKKEEVYPRSTIIKNSEYWFLILFSDGVTDCLTDGEIIAITEITNKRELAKALVRASNDRELAKALVRASNDRGLAEALVRASNDRGFLKEDNRTTAVFVKGPGESR